MVVCLVLRANVGEDYQPKGFNSSWTALSPQGNDALERSLYQMRRKIWIVLLEAMQQEHILAETQKSIKICVCVWFSPYI